MQLSVNSTHSGMVYIESISTITCSHRGGSKFQNLKNDQEKVSVLGYDVSTRPQHVATLTNHTATRKDQMQATV